MISYEPFWKTINERKITTYQLIYKQGILPDTIQRLRSGKTITTQTINTLCSVINCEVSDIMKYVPDTDDKIAIDLLVNRLFPVVRNSAAFST